MDDFLKHYGVPMRSGRYPWGSGGAPYQSGRNFTSYVAGLRKEGLSDVDIAKGIGMNTQQLRAQLSLAKDIQRKSDYAQALRLEEKGYGPTEIARRMSGEDKTWNESTIRSLLNPAIQQRAEITKATSNMLKESIEQKKYIDVGLGVETHLGISKTKLNTAIAELQEEGYELFYIPVEQLGTGKSTNIKVLCPPGTTFPELVKNKSEIRTITDWSEDSGRSFLGLKPPLSINSDRIEINYGGTNEKGDPIGGSLKDGVIEIRRGVEDISPGQARYAQVRIAVDDSHYLKGMVMFADDLPDGIDIRFNTNKKSTGNKLDAMKPMKTDKDNMLDPDNPFGATVRQRLDAKGEKVISALNIVNEEGDWNSWSKSLSSQVLAKQSPALAKKQLDLSYNIKRDEYEDIIALTNPVVKKQLLEKFADGCDSDAVHLKGAALPRQASKVILPITDLNENEIYAPTFKNGEKVVLIRHPHGGTFEIPELTVNNKSKSARAVIENAVDAVGINPKVANKLSGADFDGDTVIVIPNDGRSIKTTSSIKGLSDFDTRMAYPPFPGMKTIDGGIIDENGKKVKVGNKPFSGKLKQTEMGKASNLITDMTIKGANLDEISRAVRHSMVVIDSEKHSLNYKQSAIDNGITDLKAKYQGGPRSGASTLISKAGSEQRVYNRREVIDPQTGKKSYLYPGDVYTTSKGEIKVFSGNTYVNKEGIRVTPKIKSTRMAETEDAFTLSSGTPIESIYANHANKLKALGNESRKEAIATKPPSMSPSAKQTYASEVSSLKAKLDMALRNKPMERQAQVFANANVKAKQEANPNMEPDYLKKIRNQALAEARVRTGAHKYQIEIKPNEWDAIQAHAVSTNVLTQILNNTDIETVRQYATPRTSKAGMSEAKISKAKLMLSNGYTQSEVAEALGVSTSTITRSIQ